MIALLLWVTSALAADPWVVMPDADMIACSRDAECVQAVTACGGCRFTSVNRAKLQRFHQWKKVRCEKFTGAYKECNEPSVAFRCRNGGCVLEKKP